MLNSSGYVKNVARVALIVGLSLFVYRYGVRDDSLSEAIVTSLIAAVATVVGTMLAPLVSRSDGQARR